MDGTLTGYVARYYPELSYGNPQRGSKSLYRAANNAAPTLHGVFPLWSQLAQRAGSLILVEDWMSSMRLWSQCRLIAVPLTGTHIAAYQIADLVKLNLKKLIVMLDSDAVLKSIQLRKKLDLVINTVVVPLKHNDVKDMSTAELASLVSEHGLGESYE